MVGDQFTRKREFFLGYASAFEGHSMSAQGERSAILEPWRALEARGVVQEIG